MDRPGRRRPGIRGLLLVVSLVVLAPLAVTAQQRSGIDLSTIDKAVRPQEDFWRFANGKWLAATEIPADRPGWDSFGIVREATQVQLRNVIEAIGSSVGDEERRKIADFYVSFMDEGKVEAAGVTALKPELDRLRALDDKALLPATFARLAQIRVRTPYYVDVGPDEHDATTYLVHLGQGRLGLPDRDYYLKDDAHFTAIRAAYRTHIGKLLSLGGVPAGETEIDALIALETSMAKLQWTRVDNRNPLKIYNRRERTQLPSYLNTESIGVEAPSLVVLQPSYFEGLPDLLRDVPLATWRLYLTYNLLSSYAPYLSAAFVDEDFAFEQKTLRGTPEQQARWKRAVSTVDRGMEFALGRLYVERYFPPAAKAHAEALIVQITATYKQSIETLDWMSPATRREALDKLAGIRAKVGYPENGRTYDGLDVRRDDLVGNVQRARIFGYRYWLAKVGQKVDRTEWFAGPQIVNAFYNPNQNEILFPAGILQPPFFDPAADDAANYGGIGVVIGHEISHAFDDEGSRYDTVGNLRNWWTDADRAAFEKMTHGMIAQYDAFSPLPGYHVNGALTLGENAADNAGLAVAVKAYHAALNGKPSPVIEGYTGDQRLFLAFAQIWKAKIRDAASIERLKTDPHSPGQFRANGAVRNQTAFDEAFDVKPGDGMYLPPDQRITLW
jgi:putative endopeptidase